MFLAAADNLVGVAEGEIRFIEEARDLDGEAP
jgi:hypothetical protein